MTIIQPWEVCTVCHRVAVSLFPRLLLLLPLVLAAACGGKGGGASAASPETLAAGSKHFLGTCASCHGSDANGLPNLGKSLRINAYVMDKSDDELLLFLQTGRPANDPLNSTGVAMPPKGGNPALSDADLKAVVTYLRTLQKVTVKG